MKAPSLQFYPRDWMSDTSLQYTSISTRGVWIQLLCIMFFAPDKGEVEFVSLQKMCQIVGCFEEESSHFIAEAKQYGFCDISVTHNGVIKIRNRRMWKEEKERKNNRLRQQQYREKRRSNEEITPPSSTASASAKKKSTKKSNFTPPLFEEVKSYCIQRKNNVDPEKWHDFYTSKNWMIGKNKMKDWKAAVRTWESREKPKTGGWR